MGRTATAGNGVVGVGEGAGMAVTVGGGTIRADGVWVGPASRAPRSGGIFRESRVGSELTLAWQAESSRSVPRKRIKRVEDRRARAQIRPLAHMLEVNAYLDGASHQVPLGVPITDHDDWVAGLQFSQS